jgi:hypothetical protein
VARSACSLTKFALQELNQRETLSLRTSRSNREFDQPSVFDCRRESGDFASITSPPGLVPEAEVVARDCSAYLMDLIMHRT